MVTVSTTAVAVVVVVVLLQLHASVTEETLTEENDKTQTLSRHHVTSSRQAAGLSKQQPTRQHSQSEEFRRDEDLLDLMVRIAESPDEWERIHRVLSQIGAQQDSYQSHENKIIPNNDKVQPTSIYGEESQIGIAGMNLNDSKRREDTASRESPSSNTNTPPTLSTSTTIDATPAEFHEMDYQSDQWASGDDPDTGWPDFDEAIVKKIKKPHQVPIDNDILESDWFDDGWLDASWQEILEEQKDDTLSEEQNKIHPAVLFKPAKRKEGRVVLKDTNILRSKLYRDPKILGFPIKESVSMKNHSLDQNISRESSETNRSVRPVFLYHRVTTSPQERKGNSAFIAVSVVKQNALEPPATTQAPAEAMDKQNSLWSHTRHLHRIQDKTDDVDERRTPVRDEKLHSRGRRHHHTRTHTHTHSHH